MSDIQALADKIVKAIAPTMLFGLQDAELHDEPGEQRIREWVGWIAGTVTPLVADEVNAELQRIHAAVTEGQGTTPITASDVLVAHEVTRKALTEALDVGLHLNWPQLVDAARRSHAANTAWKTDVGRVRALHVRNRHTGSCEHCSAHDYPDYDVPWPCPTIDAITERPHP